MFPKSVNRSAAAEPRKNFIGCAMDLGDVVRVGLLGSRSVVVEAAGDRTKKFKLARPGLAHQYLACLELVLAARRGADAV
jgi:hypothetical protein